MNYPTAFGSSKKRCRHMGERLSAYVDGALTHAERREVSVHLRDCLDCAAQVEQLTQARLIVKRLPARVPPPNLSARLQVMAVRESARHQDDVSSRGMFRFSFDALQLRLSNAMRPLAIPFAGGIVSTLVLFSMLVPVYPGLARIHANDVPTVFYQEPSVKSIAPFGFAEDEVVIEVVLDEQGQVIDYSLPQGKVNTAMRREIENQLLFARFTPALAFGQPTGVRMLISFRRAQIDVKG